MDVSLVIPAYNERDNLTPLVAECDSVLGRLEDGHHEILLIEDGSLDDSAAVLDGLERDYPRLRTIRHVRGSNIGCHPSELEGLRACRGDVALFLPADLQIMPTTLPLFLSAAADADIVASRRVNRADNVARRALSLANNRVERFVMGVNVRDAHSSMLVNRRVLDEVVPLIMSRSALIPAELLLRARRRGFRITEVDISHHPRAAGRQTGAKFSEILKVQFDMLRLRRAIARET